MTQLLVGLAQAAARGRQQLHRGAGARLDLLVIDLQLPGSKGMDLLKSIRDGGCQAPMLIFSGTIPHARNVRELAPYRVAGFINEYTTPTHILSALAPHLFPDSFNRRGSPRVVLGIPVAYRFGNTIATALTLNLSRGGIAVRTTSPLEIGGRARLRFRLPGGKRELEVEARVAWSDRRTGMGLQFERVESADQSAIDEFVDAHFFNNRRA